MMGYAVFWLMLAQAGHGSQGGQDMGAVWNSHMMEEVADAHHFIIPGLNRVIDLPQLPPIHIGALSVDLSPTKHVIWLMIAATLCALTLIWTARRTHGKGAGKAPKGMANVIEAFVIYLRDEVALRNIGHGGERFVPFVLTLFFFILFMNLLGLVPFGATATGNIMVTGALAVLALVAIEVGGFLHLGPRAYLKTIVYVPEGLPWFGKIPMALIMTPVEAIAKLARIFALAIRLFANMTAGHLVILSLVGLIFMAGAGAGSIKDVVWPAPVLMAVAIMLMEIFIALLQAYIFAMLTSVFIGLVRHPH
ncbi:MAG: F0F1 ATP synthase subunit A [Gemmatimonadota bacterium]|nr:MAG: F0F1 ATP synthase subunit A [Gemmatimonadota bacterium]